MRNRCKWILGAGLVIFVCSYGGYLLWRKQSLYSVDQSTDKKKINKQETYQYPEVLTDSLKHVRKGIKWDDSGEYALIFLNEKDLSNTIGPITKGNQFQEISLDNNHGVAMNAICSDFPYLDMAIKGYFIEKKDDFSSVQNFLESIFPKENISGFDISKEHSIFFFLYQGRVCHPYPLVLEGESTAIIDSRITFFNNWRTTKNYNKIAELIFTAHNHPMDYGFTDYASADDYARPLFSYSANGFLVAGPLGFHVIRVKDRISIENLDWYTDIRPSAEGVFFKYKDAKGYVRTKEYREELRNAIFGNQKVSTFLMEDFYFRR
jgi:hypothetical protein